MKARNVYIVILIIIIGIGGYLYNKGNIDLLHPSPQMEDDIPQLNNHDFEVLGFIPYWVNPTYIPSVDYIALFALKPTKEGWENPFVNIPSLPNNTKLLWTLKIHEDDSNQWMDTKEGIIGMMRKLSPYMKHADGVVINMEYWEKYLKLDDIALTFRKMYPHKLLMITLPSWGLPTTGNLYRITDRFILMAYDYNFPKGILAPLSQVENSIQFYQYLSDKLLLGIPLYGYQKTPNGYKAIQIKNIENLPRTYSEKKEAITKLNGGKVVWNDLFTIKKKTLLVKKYHLRGIALWAIGYTTDHFIKQLLQTIDTTYP